MLLPIAVYTARLTMTMLSIAAWDWAIGVDARLDIPLWIYGIYFAFSLVFGYSDFRVRRMNGERAIIDLGALIRTRSFWTQSTIVALVVLLATLMIHNSNPLSLRFIIGFAFWTVLLTVANQSHRGRDHMKANPYISFPRRGANKGH